MTDAGKIFIGDLDMSKIRFSAMYMKEGRQHVDVYPEDSRSSKLEFNLCRDCQEPFPARYGLDPVRDDQPDKSKRGQLIQIVDPKVAEAFEALDETIIAAAVANSQEWFRSKTPLSEEMIRGRYTKILKQEEDIPTMRFRVKLSTAKVPTRLICMPEPGMFRQAPGREEELEHRGARLAPILSSGVGLWFMAGGAKFGISFQAEKMVYVPGAPPTALSGFLTKRPYEMCDEEPESLPKKQIKFEEEEPEDGGE